MDNADRFFINGQWVAPKGSQTHDVINPATEAVVATISLGSRDDVNDAVAAAKAAFPAFAATSIDERLALLDRIIEGYKARMGELAEAISSEMGAPASLAQKAQAPAGLGHFMSARKALAEFQAEENQGKSLVVREPIGVCAFITPWNWPMNQISCKVAPAIAAGCTCVLKPSEMAPLDALVLADILDEAGVPAGVFNLVNGDGPTVGQALAEHPDVDLISFTGSTRAGVQVAKSAADTVKRVQQELGGKSPNIILPDADLKKAVKGGVMGMMGNTGQSCNAPSRMFVHADQYDEAVEIARTTAERIRVGDPTDEETVMGPVASRIQHQRVLEYIRKGIDEGARLVTGGAEAPEGLNTGYYIRPTVFADVRGDMTIVKEEIFGPVLTIIRYDSEDEAIDMANDTPYGLSAYVWSGDAAHARQVAGRLRAGMVHINGAALDPAAPFGGYKQSGNGREWGAYGLDEFFEIKAIMGYEAA